ncbi:MAG: ABC transporter permease, partial [Dongiaceae bacterium]
MGVEAALAMLLVVTAGLLIESFRRMRNAPLGVEPENVLTFWLIPSEVRVPPAAAPAFVARVLEAVARVPGVQSATVDGGAPLSGTATSTLYMEGRPLPLPGPAPPVLRHYVGPDHFRTLGIPLRRGRVFTDADAAGAPRVAVISDAAARRFWPGEDPIGKRLLLGEAKNERPTVIGVVADVRRYSQAPSPNFYAPFGQTYRSINHSAVSHLVIRAATDPLNLTAAVREQILAVDRRVVIDQVMTLEQRLSNVVAQPRFYAVLLGWFGAMGLLLSVIGLYGVISYSVSQMTREVGIRIALGAQRRDILKLVVGHGLVLTIIGLALG